MVRPTSTDCEEHRYDDGQTDAARTWLTWRPHHGADDRMRAQRAVSSMARVDPFTQHGRIQSCSLSLVNVRELAIAGKSIQPG